MLHVQAERVAHKEIAVQRAIASLRQIADFAGKVSSPFSEPDLPTWRCLVGMLNLYASRGRLLLTNLRRRRSG